MSDLLKSISEFGSSAYQPKKNIDRLSIQLRLNGFSFCISDPTESKIYYFSEYKIPDNKFANQSWQLITNLFEDWLLLKKFSSDQFQEIKVVIVTNAFSILPSSFIMDENNEMHLEFNQKIDYQYHIIKNEILNTNQEILFPIYSGLNTVIQEYLSSANIKHAMTVLHESIFSNLKNHQKENQVFAFVSERNLYLIAYKAKELVFTNCYQYTSKEDFIYFILLVYHSLNFNADTDKLNLTGDINPSSALYNICYQYIRNVFLLNQISNLNVNSDFDSFPIHQYFVQINQAL